MCAGGLSGESRPAGRAGDGRRSRRSSPAGARSNPGLAVALPMVARLPPDVAPPRKGGRPTRLRGQEELDGDTVHTGVVAARWTTPASTSRAVSPSGCRCVSGRPVTCWPASEPAAHATDAGGLDGRRVDQAGAYCRCVLPVRGCGSRPKRTRSRSCRAVWTQCHLPSRRHVRQESTTVLQLAGRELARQQAPGAATAHHRAERGEDAAARVDARASASGRRGRWGDPRLQDRPLGIRQLAGGGEAVQLAQPIPYDRMPDVSALSYQFRLGPRRLWMRWGHQ